ncbi:metal ABC transporter permease [Ammonifex thiophilus]|uniref:Metal ABC transporter permease n=2 Tax=Ammonifex thiophilus TaxID=444093 RepID=A0A3D8P6J7_9THEO|nr:metal ABC transporter permease [Ammonifex thiophilus]
MLDMWQYGFFWRGIIAGLLVGFLCPLVGVFLVARRYSFLPDALAHVSLTGIALGLILHFSPDIVTVMVLVAAAWLTEWLRNKASVYADALLAVVMAVGLALGVILISKSRGFGADLSSYLFGSLLTVRLQDLKTITVALVLVLGMVAVFYRGLLAVALDEEYAQAVGIPVRHLSLVFIALSALTVAAAIKVAGVLLTGALVVIPSLLGAFLGRSFAGTLKVAVGTGVLLSLLGMHLAYWGDLPPGPAIILLGAGMLVLVILGRRFAM